MGCRHKRTHTLAWDLGTWWHSGTEHARRCNDCGAWLPIGPANDTPREVQVEMRAAEIAANVADYFERGRTHSIYIDEDIGWRVGVRDWDKPWLLDQQHAGHLARCIHDHGCISSPDAEHSEDA